MGGLSKKAYQFDVVEQKMGVEPIILDGGSLLFKGSTLSRGKEEQERISAAGIVKSYNNMGYQGVGVTVNDLAAGLDFLRQMQKKSTFTWLSANLVDSKTLQPVFAAKIIIPVNGLKVGVTALTSLQANKVIKKEQHVELLPWQEILPNIISQFAGESDMLILLSNLSVADNQAIAKQYKNIHIIMQAGVSTANLAPRLINNTLLCQTTSRGKYIGVMEIEWQASALWGDKTKEQLQKKKGDLDRTLWQISKYKKYKDPVKDLAVTPKRLNSYLRLISKQKGLEMAIERLEKQMQISPEGSDVQGPPATFHNRFVAIGSNLPDKEEIVAIVEEVNDDIFELGKKQAAAMASTDNSYTGWQACKDCHSAITAVWQQSKHAKAYETLVQKNRQFDLNCVPCHVTGVLLSEAGKALKLSEGRQMVGCESCHGSGKKHVADPERYKLKALPVEKTCLTCHTAAHDNDFDYDRDIKLIH